MSSLSSKVAAMKKTTIWSPAKLLFTQTVPSNSKAMQNEQDMNLKTTRAPNNVLYKLSQNSIQQKHKNFRLSKTSYTFPWIFLWLEVFGDLSCSKQLHKMHGTFCDTTGGSLLRKHSSRDVFQRVTQPVTGPLIKLTF